MLKKLSKAAEMLQMEAKNLKQYTINFKQEIDSLKHYRKLIQGKRIAVVGNAEEAEVVDDYDLVVRFNNSWVENKGRQDILYADVSKIFSPSNDLKFVHFYLDSASVKLQGEACELLGIPHSYYILAEEGPTPLRWPWKLRNDLRCRPFTGILAIYHLLQYNVKTVFVTGFDFYRQSNGYVPIRIGPHYLPPQINWLYREAGSNPKLQVDEVLGREILFIKN